MSNNLQILSHYVEGEPDGAHEPDFLFYRMMDHGDVLALYEQERQGQTLCVTDRPWTRHDNPRRKLGDDTIYSELVSADDCDFRSSLDSGECKCSHGKVCIVCCTNRDLLDVPSGIDLGCIQKVNSRTRVIRDHFEEVFDLLMSRGDARKMGLLPSEE